MQTGLGAHADEETLEKYSLKTLPEAETARLEEHLLVCPKCQGRLEEIDHFVAAIRQVAPRLRAEARLARRAWWRLPALPAMPKLALAGTLAVLVLAFLVGRTWISAPGASSAPAIVILQLHRGPEAGSGSWGPAGKPLTLETDVSQLAPFPTYNIEIVNSSGEPVFASKGQAKEGALRVQVSRAFSAGTYFVRLYSPTGELLREFGLHIR
jgi:hypothetical protein